MPPESQPERSNAVVWAWVIIAIGIVIAGYYYLLGSKEKEPVAVAPVQPSLTVTQPPVSNETPAPAAPTSDMPQGVSDTALDDGMNMIDAKMNALTDDEKNIDTGLNDQPIDPTQ